MFSLKTITLPSLLLLLLLLTAYLSSVPSPSQPPPPTKPSPRDRIRTNSQATSTNSSGDITIGNAWQARNNHTDPSSLDMQFCTYDQGSIPYFSWGILIPNDPSMDSSCSEGFLNNFRGCCGVISNWGCVFVRAQSTTAALAFSTDVGCTAYDGAVFIAAASGGVYPAMDCFNANDAYDGGDVGTDMPFTGDGGVEITDVDV